MKNKTIKSAALLMLMLMITPLFLGTALTIKASNLPTLTNNSDNGDSNDSEDYVDDDEYVDDGEGNETSGDIEESLNKAKDAVSNILPNDSVGISDENRDKAAESTAPIRNLANNVIALIFTIAAAWIPVTVAMDVLAGVMKPIRTLVDGSKFKIQLTSDAFGTLTSGDKLNWGGWFKESTINVVIALVFFALIASGSFWSIMIFLSQGVISVVLWGCSFLKGMIS